MNGQNPVSNELKSKLLADVQNGKPIEPSMFDITRRDRVFQATLVRKAEEVKNTAFFESMEVFIAEKKSEYWRLYGIAAEEQLRAARSQRKALRRGKKKKPRNPEAKATSQTESKTTRIEPRCERSPNYNPTGVSFIDFLKERGLCPPTFIRFLSGGAIESNRRRH